MVWLKPKVISWIALILAVRRTYVTVTDRLAVGVNHDVLVDVDAAVIAKQQHLAEPGLETVHRAAGMEQAQVGVGGNDQSGACPNR